MKVWSLLLGFASLLSLAYPAMAKEAVCGATLPWVTYEAEQAVTNGTLLGPDYTGQTAAREASGRSCVRLTASGQYIQFTANADAQGLIVRYCIPDSPDGRGTDATLSLYISGQPKKKLPMTSRYSYLYGQYPFNKHPASGSPRHFWDEVRLMPGPIHKGDVIRLQKDADDSAAQYLIDFVDLESVPAPLEQPPRSLSVTDFGAISNSQIDARPAFLAAMAAAKSQHKSVWIPAGSIVIKGAIQVSDVAIRGAGMWYSTLVGVDNYAPENRIAIYGNGSNITLADFAIIGRLNYRNDSEPNDGIGGSFGEGSAIRNIWVEHTKTGAWLVNSNGLLVEGCRFRDTVCDGINLCVGMRNTTVRNSTARGTGDDCFAMWPATYMKSLYRAGSNRFVSCTAQLPSLAQAFAIYGGSDNSVESCEAIDVPYGAGLFASTTFPTEFGFDGTTSYRQIRLTRTGAGDGSIATVADLTDLQGLRFQDIQVINSATDGIRFTSMHGHALRDTSFDRIRIISPGMAGAGCGIAEAPGAVGSATISNITVQNPRTPASQQTAPEFKLVQGKGNPGAEVNALSAKDDLNVQTATVGP